ncbi:hypothetical protein P153DRAFT_326836 [Dothidotthia symphoricarpi CBS 119687]|uniref:Zn(2)-C6 fungal-type domain-containing protein n=1 Tax=Dothidotthia symphoricarpi CBS 119687 TaxID=1392245 RepID=A0A6A5ZZU1_9PLEO|nr:uncharacterized protein P153DRAFT_326836 [Dothidotthia symphoricarpi CBS 119687]KAF2124535.1 hypothetical protein P153DRAFT_326836 [Dothidotthia symphoricarpi CBS 119687]
MSTFSGDHIQPSVNGIIESNKRKQRAQQQSRQLLSCTKCRERKVKCDRTKPCSACCARGAPKECHFVAEGGDYAPIQQSYELRKLRTENMLLKERLRANQIPIDEDDSDTTTSPDSQLGERPTSSSQKRRVVKQRRFQGSERTDSIYFGSPGLANVIADFAAANLTPTSAQSLAYLMPRGQDAYTPKTPLPDPFATLFSATPDQCIPQLLKILPADEHLLEYLDAFERRITVCSFPQVSIEITKSEVERFLSDRRKNAAMCPDMLALLFAAMALGAQHSVWDRGGGQWNANIIDEETQKGNVYIAAAMQALRMSSFMHKPTILGIETLIMIGPYLTHSGRHMEAWTLFGTTIRMAQAIGLHRNPKYLNPAPPTQRECAIRQTLWWWMLHMDEQYSMTLGRPLGISGIGDCPPPHELTTDPRMLRFGEFVNHFTLLARQILSGDRMTDAKIDEFTDLLRTLLDTMPEMLQFDESWIIEETEIPEWPLRVMAAVYFCKTHTYLILLNRQRTDTSTGCTQTPNTTVSTSSFRPVNYKPSPNPSPTASSMTSPRGRSLVLSSSEDILTAFLFFYHRVPAALVSWTISQQAFNSCMLLLLDALEIRQITPAILKVEQAYVIFLELQNNGVHRLAILAVERISWGLQELHHVLNPTKGESFTRGCQGFGEADLHGDAKSRARDGSQALPDAVMSNTGMLLLEDSGLQSFIPESFEAFSWIAAEKDELGDTSPLKQEPDRPDLRCSEDIHKARSTRKVQEMWESASGSVSPRYAVSQQKQGCQLQGITTPTPRAGLAPATHQKLHGIKSVAKSRRRPGPSPRHRTGRQREIVEARQRRHIRADDPPQMPSRHHSWPSLSQSGPVPPLARHTRLSPRGSRLPSAGISHRHTLADSGPAPDQHLCPDIVPQSDHSHSVTCSSWLAQPASMPDTAEPVAMPTMSGYGQDQQMYQYDFSSRFSNATRRV